MSRPIPILLLAALLVGGAAACSGEDDSGAAPAATSAPTTSAVTATTISATPPETPVDPDAGDDSDDPAQGPGTTTPPSGSPTTRPTTPPTTRPADQGPTGVEADGSGCAVDAATLPDGRWYGLVSSATAGGLEFDLACWFSGEAAVEAAARDGEESPPPNDYYVRNESTRLRSVPVSPGAMASWIRETGNPSTEVRTPYDQWLTARADRMVFGVWLEVRDGAVRTISEQWVP